MSGKPWTPEEDAILRPLAERWGSKGVPLALKNLPGRTRRGAYMHALKSEWIDPKPLTKLPNRDDLDAQIKRLYQQPTTRGMVKELAARMGRPTWWVSRRARELGLVLVRRKEPDWTTPELDLLSETAHLSDESAWRVFRRRGFKRTVTSIMVKRRRCRINANASGHYSAGQLADLLGTDSKTVSRWILHEQLAAKKRGTKRTEVQGGDVWMISERALREAVINHPLMVNLRKIPASSQAWFIDVLGGRAGNATRAA